MLARAESSRHKEPGHLHWKTARFSLVLTRTKRLCGIDEKMLEWIFAPWFALTWINRRSGKRSESEGKK